MSLTIGFLAHLSIPVETASVRVCPYVCVSTLSNMNIFATSGPIAITILLKHHHLGGGKASLRFGPDRIRTLVSMATDSSHRVISKKIL